MITITSDIKPTNVEKELNNKDTFVYYIKGKPIKVETRWNDPSDEALDNFIRELMRVS